MPKKLVAKTGVDASVLENCVRNLMLLGMLKPSVVTEGITMINYKLPAYKNTEMFDTTQMGIDFFHVANDAPES